MIEQETFDTEYLSVPEKNEIDKMETYKDIIREMKPRYNSFNKTDKSYIRSIAKDLGVKIGTCSNCYRDAYLEIRGILGITEVKVEKDTGIGYKFVGKGDIQWHGPFGNVRLNEMTPLKSIERYIADNPGQKVFVKIENNN
jgi:hypothetical protein